MMTGTPVIQASEAAYMLRVKLGPIRAWADFLADNIRGKQSIQGLTLKPCCRKKIGKAFRPMYALTDIEAFIAKVLKIEPKAGKAPIKPVLLDLDRKKPWRYVKFDEEGEPAAMLRRAIRNAKTLATIH